MKPHFCTYFTSFSPLSLIYVYFKTWQTLVFLQICLKSARFYTLDINGIHFPLIFFMILSYSNSHLTISEMWSKSRNIVYFMRIAVVQICKYNAFDNSIHSSIIASWWLTWGCLWFLITSKSRQLRQVKLQQLLGWAELYWC